MESGGSSISWLSLSQFCMRRIRAQYFWCKSEILDDSNISKKMKKLAIHIYRKLDEDTSFIWCRRIRKVEWKSRKNEIGQVHHLPSLWRNWMKAKPSSDIHSTFPIRWHLLISKKDVRGKADGSNGFGGNTYFCIAFSICILLYVLPAVKVMPSVAEGSQLLKPLWILI
jgi:hypothetical protein